MRIRIASFNVEFSKSTTPEEVGEMFRPFAFDLIGFCEVPDGDWTARVGRVLGMEHAFVGAISSANHQDKYKSILSRQPLRRAEEVRLEVEGGWNPASVVRAEVAFGGAPILFHSLHICSCGLTNGHARLLAQEVLAKETRHGVVAVGDFNSRLGDEDMNAFAAAGLRSAWQDLPLDTTGLYTYNAFDPTKSLGVIDHIVYSAGIKATDGGIIELTKPLSDHKPIWAELALPVA